MPFGASVGHGLLLWSLQCVEVTHLPSLLSGRFSTFSGIVCCLVKRVLRIVLEADTTLDLSVGCLPFAIAR